MDFHGQGETKFLDFDSEGREFESLRARQGLHRQLSRTVADHHENPS